MIRTADVRTVAKMADRLVEIHAVKRRVEFSDDEGWILVTTDVGLEPHLQMNFRWVPATTRFEWVRDFSF